MAGSSSRQECRWIPACLASIVAACAGPVVKHIGQVDVEGTVVDRDTGQPLAGACVTETLDRGGFWTEPGQYLIGHACTDAAGRFRIAARPRTVYNAADPDSTPAFSVSVGGYVPSIFVPTSETLAAGTLLLTLKRSAPGSAR